MTTNIYVEEFLTSNYTPNIIRQIKSLIGIFFISPLFLLLSIMIYFFVPQKIIRFEYREVLHKFVISFSKRFIDISGAIICFLLFIPVFIIVPLIIKFDSKGPVFYKQQRIGLNRRKRDRRSKIFDTFSNRRNGDRRGKSELGKVFTLYKFRTMREDAEKKTGPVWAIQNDPRITNIGRFLRNSHIDEIPQLYNILKGDMSFVGPRPERPFFVNRFSNTLPNYSKRFVVKPGLTGWAQINCGYDTSIDDVKEKLKYELEYVEKDKSIIFDLQILCKTLFYLFNKRNIADTNEPAISI